MRNVVSQFRIADKYTVMQLDGPVPMKSHRKYRIDGVEHQIIPLYDLPNCIAVRETGDYVGKTVEFV